MLNYVDGDTLLRAYYDTMPYGYSTRLSSSSRHHLPDNTQSSSLFIFVLLLNIIRNEFGIKTFTGLSLFSMAPHRFSRERIVYVVIDVQNSQFLLSKTASHFVFGGWKGRAS